MKPLALLLLPLAALATDAPTFNGDVRTILSDKCFRCHGPDAKARKADLRLDVREDATADHDGVRAIVPGRPDDSELVKRIEATDEDDVMPPPKSKLALTKVEKDVLRRWIAAGAEYQPHWAFVPPRDSLGSIDDFIRARLAKEGLAPSREADRTTLIRRVSLDLTGIPPTPEEVDAFLADAAPGAYERVVDRLLASPRFGERMAMDWLDAARYADTNGYFSDKERAAWPWREWVIRAFNRNMPFDQFTIEQLAGDLLDFSGKQESANSHRFLPSWIPESPRDCVVATGFNRNHMVTNESGIIDEEYRVEYVADRLETTGTVWLGLTVGCARCHDHKYDPLTQREYYELFAFFNNGPETGLVKDDSPPPTLDVTTPAQHAELEKLTAERKAKEEHFAKLAEPLRAPMAEWEKTSAAELAPLTDALAAHVEFEPDGAGEVKGGNVSYEPGVLGNAGTFDAMQHIELPADVALEADQPWSIGVWMKPTGSLNCVLSKIDPAGDRRGFELVWQKGYLQINLVNRWVASAIELVTKEPIKGGGWQQAIVSYDGSRKAAGVRVFVNGAAVPLKVVRDRLDGPMSNTQPLRIGRRDNGLGYYGQLDELRLYRRAITTDEAQAWHWSDRLRGIFATAPEKRDAKQKGFVLDYYVSRHADAATRAAHDAADSAKADEEKYRAQLPKTLVMQELPKPRATHVLVRGQYSAPGDEVSANVPASLPPFPADAPRNRLGLARWLVSPSNPLTARVQVNRLWRQCFGEGLVRTVNDFGVQGEPPTHPELLDWLAVRFVESGWDVKAMLKLIVMSATYRQSSVPTRELLARDPENRLHARGPRFRLPAETIRDQALAASGLLVERIGGPSVKPYQPPGLWEAVSYDGELRYEPDTGDGLWRRSLYTFWKRQAPPPALLTFDAPTRETCFVRRARTNTPLQALVLLNDETYVEAARALAALALAQPGGDDARLRFAFRRILSRSPGADELLALARLLALQRSRFEGDAASAVQLGAVGASPRGRDLEPARLAAWTVVVQALLNLDEAITRR